MLKSKSRYLVSALFLLAICSGARAGYILDEPILGGNFFVGSNGGVQAQFLGSDAGYFNTLYLDGLETPIFNKISKVGSWFDLGEFNIGDELVFRLDVHNTGLSFFSGDGSNNPDLLPHARAITTLQDDLFITTVGFEDIHGGGDQDYNDFEFLLRNVIDPPAQTGTGPEISIQNIIPEFPIQNSGPEASQPSPVPEPPLQLLFATGLLAMVAVKRRRNLK